MLKKVIFFKSFHLEDPHLSQDFEMSEMERDIQTSKNVIFLCQKITIVSQCFSFCWEIYILKRKIDKNTLILVLNCLNF